MSLAKDLSVIFTSCHLTIISSGQAAVEKKKHNPERFTNVKAYKNQQYGKSRKAISACCGQHTANCRPDFTHPASFISTSQYRDIAPFDQLC